VTKDIPYKIQRICPVLKNVIPYQKTFGDNSVVTLYARLNRLSDRQSVANEIYETGEITTTNFFHNPTEYMFIYNKCHFPNFSDMKFYDTPYRSIYTPNAGGASELSEAATMQLIQNLLGVSNFVLEQEVKYYIDGKKVDFVFEYINENIGVSVTRAISYPFDKEFSYEQAYELLTKKMYGLIIARSSAIDEHSFFKSVLHIWCMNTQTVDNIDRAFHNIALADVDLTYNTISVMCTICDNDFIYSNKK